MKDFLKWLGVNEKVAKVAIWLFIIMVCLIVVNTALDSLGLPYYKITMDNLVKINSNKLLDYLCSCLTTLLNFYTVIFLVFRVKNFKKIFPYSILYLFLNIIVSVVFGYVASQTFIVCYIAIFCYLFSKKKPKYIAYAFASYIVNIIIQYVWYLYKFRFLEYSTINRTTKIMLSIDFFIIMAIVIFSKEIYLKKRGEIKCQSAYYGSENSKKKATLPKN